MPALRGSFRLGLAWQIALGLVIGVVAGVVLSHYPETRSSVITEYFQPAGDLFIRMIKMVVVPIVFTSMVVGIAGVGDGKSLGRIGLKTIIYFEIITTIAIVLGLVFGNILQPGAGTDISQLGHADVSKFQQAAAGAAQSHGFMSLILGIIPENILASMSRGELLPVLFFSVLFGLGLQSVPKDIRQPVIDTLRGVSDAMFKVTGMVMRYAPIGVAALITVTVANFGFSSLLPLLKLVSVTYLAIIVFTLVVLGVTARLTMLLAWIVFEAWGMVIGLVVAVIFLDFGAQGAQVSNQHVIQSLRPEARNRLNAILMSGMFLGGALGSAGASFAWTHGGWSAVCGLGALLALAGLGVHIAGRRHAKASNVHH